MASSTPTTALLHSSPTLIDIPLSLSLAQLLSPLSPLSPPHTTPPSTIAPLPPTAAPPPPTPLPPFRTLFSTPAPSEPYPSTEPKSEKARRRVLERVGGGGGHGGAGIDGARNGGGGVSGVDEEWVRDALRGLRREYHGVWCSERRVKAGVDDLGGGRTRKRRGKSQGDGAGNGGDAIEELHLHPAAALHINPTPIPWHLTARAQHSSTLTALHHRPIHNAHSSPCYLDLIASYKQEREPYRYLIPPLSTFLLSSITTQTTPAFTHAALTLLPERTPSAGPGQFDFVLLDPPWANRSVRRSGKYSTAESHGGLDPMTALEGMLDQHVAPAGLVGCWITNKAAVRTAALDAFAKWDVELVEEWVWVKVTSRGEPVTELGGVWRKPYEVLLLGRKGAASGERVERMVGRRLIVAVPDLHSRKPNLKEMVEPMMPDARRYRALEVFARNLTAGWWAWGDECLKYNWDGYWSGAD